MAASVSLKISDTTIALWLANGNLECASVLAQTARVMSKDDPTAALVRITGQIKTLDKTDLHYLHTLLTHMQHETRIALDALMAQQTETADLAAP